MDELSEIGKRFVQIIWQALAIIAVAVILRLTVGPSWVWMGVLLCLAYLGNDGRWTQRKW
jgi:hypothetical protein